MLSRVVVWKATACREGWVSVSTKVTELRLCGTHWVLSGDPYVLYRAEKAIPFSSKKDGRLSWLATDEIADELMWLCQRFEVRIIHSMEMRRAAARHNLRKVETGRILAGDFRSDAVVFSGGMSPRLYQTQAAMLWRTNRGLLCADELGVGKTATAIAGIADRAMLPAVIVVPANIQIQWREQIHKFLEGFQPHIISQTRNYDLRVVAQCKSCGEAADKRSVALRRCRFCKSVDFRNSLADVYIISYAKMDAWHKELARVVKSVVFDEAQDLRRDESSRYKACKALAHSVEYRLALSATPVHNYGGEMYNVMNVVAPKVLGPKKHFREQWCSVDSYQAGREPHLLDPEALSRYLQDRGLMIRRTRKDVGRELLPDQQIVVDIDHNSDVFSRMTKDAKELARVMLKYASSQLKGQEGRAAGQLNAMVRHATGVAKAPYVANFVRMLLESGEPVMLFGHHLSVYEIWCRELSSFNPVLYTGNESSAQKELSKQKFLAGDSQLFICALQSGRGLDGIQNRCHIGVIGELDWSPAVIRQSIGRYYRDGQKEPCVTYIPLSQVGSDPHMVESLGIKRIQVDGVVLSKRDSNVLSEVETARHLRSLAMQFLGDTSSQE